MNDLKRGGQKGRVALCVLTWATYFADFTVRETPAAPWERHVVWRIPRAATIGRSPDSDWARRSPYFAAFVGRWPQVPEGATIRPGKFRLGGDTPLWRGPVRGDDVARIRGRPRRGARWLRAATPIPAIRGGPTPRGPGRPQCCRPSLSWLRSVQPFAPRVTPLKHCLPQLSARPSSSVGSCASSSAANPGASIPGVSVILSPPPPAISEPPPSDWRTSRHRSRRARPARRAPGTTRPRTTATGRR